MTHNPKFKTNEGFIPHHFSAQNLVRMNTSLIKSGAGFTLLELLLVIFIIGLSAALSIPAIGPAMDNLNVKAGAKNLSSILRYARNTAIEERQTYSVKISDENIVFLVPVYKPESKKEMRIKEEVRIARVTRFSEETPLKERTIIFYPKGNSSGGAIEIIDKDNRPAYVIKVEPSTGRVKVERM